MSEAKKDLRFCKAKIRSFNSVQDDKPEAQANPNPRVQKTFVS
jgi:hypothetical protein